MERVRITKRLLEGHPAEERDRTIWDSELIGFGVHVRASGRKTFVVQHRIRTGRGARQKKFTLGSFSEVTPDQARSDARQIIAKLHRQPELIVQEERGQESCDEARSHGPRTH